MQRTLTDLRELVQIEVSLAKNEARAELRQVKVAAISLFLAYGLAIAALNLLIFSVFLALGATVLVTSIAGVALAASALGLGLWARASFPKSILADTRKRLSEDVNRIKEHAA